jgi:CubicO group peptidase (beta-lactamase class C family)
MKYLLLLLPLLLCFSCSDDEPTEPAAVVEDTYFPPISGSSWEQRSPEELNWNTAALEELYADLEAADSRAFIILKNGRIVAEQYWGTTLLGSGNFAANTDWYWASAGKTLRATLVGIAEQKGLLQVNQPVSDFLGNGWSSLTPEQEGAIQLRHLLSMSSGLDYRVTDLDCNSPQCLTYLAPPDTRWFYHNGPHHLLNNVLEAATGKSYNALSEEWLEDKIGMAGEWRVLDQHPVYFSTARDMARYGLLIEQRGNWESNIVIENDAFFEQMISPSQSMNPSYGYLWWLNGQQQLHLPSVEFTLPRSLEENAPADMFSGLGLNGQLVCVVPSKQLVIVRMGDSDSSNEGLIGLDMLALIWGRMAQVLPE